MLLPRKFYKTREVQGVASVLFPLVPSEGMKKSIALAAIFLSLMLFGCASAPINEGMTTDGRAYRGAANPKLIIYEYSDFQCPFCSRAQGTVEEVLRAYPNEVQLQFRHYPLMDVHPQSYGAALAAVCAEEQGKFWQMHDRMFASQEALFDADLKKYASEIGLDGDKFDICLSSAATALKVRGDMDGAASAGVQSTPNFKIGESLVKGAQPFSKFKQVIDSELASLG